MRKKLIKNWQGILGMTLLIFVSVLNYANEKYWEIKFSQGLGADYSGPYEWAEPMIHGPIFIIITIIFTMVGIVLTVWAFLRS